MDAFESLHNLEEKAEDLKDQLKNLTIHNPALVYEEDIDQFYRRIKGLIDRI